MHVTFKGPMHSRFPTGFVFDEDIFEVLLPFKKTWRDGKLDAPEKFASTSLFERAFSELFFCHDMYVTTDIQQLSQPFTSLPAVRECTSLDIVEPPSTLTAIDIIEWLNADASSEEPKRLEANHHELGGTVEDLIQLLKTVSMSRRKGIVRRGHAGIRTGGRV